MERQSHINQWLEAFPQASGLFGAALQAPCASPTSTLCPVVLKYSRLAPCTLPPGSYLGHGILPYFLRAVLPVVTVVAGHSYQASGLNCTYLKGGIPPLTSRLACLPRSCHLTSPYKQHLIQMGNSSYNSGF